GCRRPPRGSFPTPPWSASSESPFYGSLRATPACPIINSGDSTRSYQARFQLIVRWGTEGLNHRGTETQRILPILLRVSVSPWFNAGFVRPPTGRGRGGCG